MGKGWPKCMGKGWPKYMGKGWPKQMGKGWPKYMGKGWPKQMGRGWPKYMGKGWPKCMGKGWPKQMGRCWPTSSGAFEITNEPFQPFQQLKTQNTTSFGCTMSRAWPGRICRLLKNSIFLSVCTIFWSHQFVRNLIPSLLQFFVAFHVEKIYATCSRRGCALLYRWFSGPWRPGPFPSRPIYQRAVAHEQKGTKGLATTQCTQCTNAKNHMRFESR